MNKLTIDDINVKGKRVLVRVDFNVPLDGSTVTDAVVPFTASDTAAGSTPLATSESVALMEGLGAFSKAPGVGVYVRICGGVVSTQISIDTGLPALPAVLTACTVKVCVPSASPRGGTSNDVAAVSTMVSGAASIA